MGGLQRGGGRGERVRFGGGLQNAEGGAWIYIRDEI